MNECPSVDALTTIGGALDWDVENGLRHLTTCAACAQQLHALQLTHEAFEIREEVGDDVVAEITHLLSAEAAQERVRVQRKHKLGAVLEALLAGSTGVVVVSGGGVSIPGSATAAVFATVAAAVLAYRTFASRRVMASS